MNNTETKNAAQLAVRVLRDMTPNGNMMRLAAASALEDSLKSDPKTASDAIKEACEILAAWESYTNWGDSDTTLNGIRERTFSFRNRFEKGD